MRSSFPLLPLLAALGGSASAQPVEEAASADFRSIELRGGGLVTVRHGAERRVTVLRANPDRPIRTDGDRLVIDRCGHPCPGGHRIEVDIVTPEIARLAVSDGGRIVLEGDFPPQAELAASVSSGGMIDMRRIEAESIAAAVQHGGRILARPGRGLAASVSNGGNVTYWGDAAVTSSISHGGVVERGEAADLVRPLVELGERPAPPPARSAPARRARKH